MSAISLYYRLKVLKQVYVSEPADGAAGISVPVATHVALWATAALVVVLGCWPDLLHNRIVSAFTTALH